MARRKPAGPGMRRVAALLLLLTAMALIYGLWWLHRWRPDVAAYPSQGVEVGADDGVVDWPALKATGASFAYLDASASAFARDPAFTRNLTDARAARLRVGAVHRYDPCQPGDRQAANFVTLVPRDTALLPPAVALAQLADDCPVRVTDAAVEREFTTFLNQIETHTGRPAVLRISAGFERRYGFAGRFDRELWLARTLIEPDYAGRPWALWTANGARGAGVSEHPLRWVVAQP
jgi:lysozyme